MTTGGEAGIIHNVLTRNGSPRTEAERNGAILENDIEKIVRRKKETVRFRNELNALSEVGASLGDKD